MKEELKVGDPVLVIDQGLLMLQKFAPKNSFPNNYGRISEILEKDYLVEHLTGPTSPTRKRFAMRTREKPQRSHLARPPVSHKQNGRHPVRYRQCVSRSRH